MSPDHENFQEMSLDNALAMMTGSDSGSRNAHKARAVFLYNQSKFIERQAIAAEDAAQHTKRNANFMLFSVIVLTISSVLTLLISFLSNVHFYK